MEMLASRAKKENLGYQETMVILAQNLEPGLRGKDGNFSTKVSSIVPQFRTRTKRKGWQF